MLQVGLGADCCPGGQRPVGQTITVQTASSSLQPIYGYDNDWSWIEVHLGATFYVDGFCGQALMQPCKSESCRRQRGRHHYN